MSVSRRRKRHLRKERSSVQILEESFHLLRSVDVRYFWFYFLGTAPFAAGLLYFVADMSRSSLARETVIPASLAMAGLYFWMRYCQARFCEGVWDTINPGSPSAIGGWNRFGNLSAFFIVQALQVPLLLAGALFVVPVGWVIAMLQNTTVLTFTKNFQRRALRGLVKSSLSHSHHEWGQNHGILIVLLFVSAFVWFNVVGSCLALATFAKAFLGVESAFTLSPLVTLFNSTFFLGSLLLTYLVISPMMKAVYVLRCFYAESFNTGEDLLSRLASCKSGRGESSTESASAKRTGRADVIVLSLLFLYNLDDIQKSFLITTLFVIGISSINTGSINIGSLSFLIVSFLLLLFYFFSYKLVNLISYSAIQISSLIVLFYLKKTIFFRCWK